MDGTSVLCHLSTALSMALKGSAGRFSDVYSPFLSIKLIYLLRNTYLAMRSARHIAPPIQHRLLPTESFIIFTPSAGRILYPQCVIPCGRMPDTQIQIKWHIEIDGDSLDNFVISQPRHQPVQFGYNIEHAEYVEFGTGPKRNRATYWIGAKGKQALNDWARKKLNMNSAKERKQFVEALAVKLGKYGMTPQPFWRPAFYSVADNMQSYYDMGKSLEDMGNEVHRISNNLIEAQGIPYQGDIQREWYIDTVPIEDVRNWQTKLTVGQTLADMMDWRKP